MTYDLGSIQVSNRKTGITELGFKVIRAKSNLQTPANVPRTEWSALSKHRDFEKSDIFPSFLSRVPEFGTVKRIVNAALQPQSEKEKIFTAPVTEILIAKLRPETPREKFEEILGLMHGGVKVTPGAVTSAHGITVLDPDTYVFVCGWESVEVCTIRLLSDLRN